MHVGGVREGDDVRRALYPFVRCSPISSRSRVLLGRPHFARDAAEDEWGLMANCALIEAVRLHFQSIWSVVR